LATPAVSSWSLLDLQRKILRGELAEGDQAALEVGLAALERDGDVGGVRVGVDGGDEDRVRGGLGAGDPREGARAQGGPQARLEQQGLDLVGAEAGDVGAGVGLELDLIVGLAAVLDGDDQRPGRPASRRA
jgi:hypothetical protein